MAKKIINLFLFLSLSNLFYSQYGNIDAILDILEEKKGINENLKNISIDDKKFVLIKDYEKHTERNFIVIKGDQVTYIELKDDKETGKTTSKIFTGDVVKTNKNIVSIRLLKEENKKIPIPINKIFLLTQQRKILYLLEINTKERWIDEQNLLKKTK